MTDKKGQCPVHFLWRGEGAGQWLMGWSILGLLTIMFIKLLSLMFHWALSGAAIISFGLVVIWAIGKASSILKHGAQKRTRTSTK